MSNSRADDRVSILIEDAPIYDFQALHNEVDALDFSKYTGAIVANAFTYCDEQIGRDPFEFINGNSPPSLSQSDEDAMRHILHEDVKALEERVRNPSAHERESENYLTFGYGFDVIRVGEHMVLTGTENEFLSAAGEVPEDELYLLEYFIFDRLLRLRLVKAPG